MDINLKPLYPDNPQVPDAPIDIYTDHPWKHPGKAPVWSPCGIGGGNPRGCFDYDGKPKPCDAGADSHGDPTLASFRSRMSRRLSGKWEG